MSQATGFLLLAVALDVIANLFLKYSQGFQRKAYGLTAIFLVISAFASMAQAIKIIDLSIAYAVWGGIGLLATTLLDCLMFGQKLTLLGWGGLGLITVGVVLLHMV